MTLTLHFLDKDFTSTRNHLISGDGLERAAFCIVAKDRVSNNFYIRQIILIHEYKVQTPSFNEISEEALVALLNTFRNHESLGLLEIHSHPFSFNAQFSSVDNDKYPPFMRAILRRKKNGFFMRMVVGKNDNGFTCFYTSDSGQEIPVNNISIISESGLSFISSYHSVSFMQNIAERFIRNIQVWGKENQRKIANVKLGFIGAGSVMFPLIQAAMHSGFRNFCIADPDTIEKVNLNRLLGASPEDVGEFKVDVIKKLMLRFDDILLINTEAKKIQERDVQDMLSDCNVLVSGVDNDLARLAIQTFSSRYMMPMLDIGTGIYLNSNGTIKTKGAKVKFYIPGYTPCLVCQGLDIENVLSESLETSQRLTGYIMETNETPGSIISLNMTISSIALSLLTDFVSGNTPPSNQILYDELNHIIKHTNFKKRDDCKICSTNNGIEGQGYISPSLIGGKKSFPKPAGLLRKRLDQYA